MTAVRPSSPVLLGMPALPTSPRGTGHLRGDESFPDAARRSLTDTQLRRNLGKATRTIRGKRAAVVAELPDWEALREAGRQLKVHTMAHLPDYLVQLEEAVTARGGLVHWARDAEEANRIVVDLVRATGADEVVKVKSMATQEIALNEALEAAGIAAFETDLAELIVQLGHDKPSHILVPAIHRNRAEIREIFLREMADVDPELSDEPAALAAAARRHRGASGTCAATRAFPPRPGTRSRTRSCGPTSATRPAPSGPSAPPSSPSCPTGRSCARRAASSRSTRWRTCPSTWCSSRRR